MEIRTLTTFVKIAELKNFSKAAEALGYSQSAVSMQIGQLEKELDVKLFDRIGKTIQLTEKGKELFGSARQILAMTEEAKKNIKEIPAVSGTLRIAMAESISIFLFYEVIKEYSALYPEVEVTIKTGVTDEMLAMLYHNEVDLIYTLDFRNFQSDLVIAYEKPEPVTFIAGKSHVLAGKKRIPLKKLLAEHFILTEKGMSYRHHLDQILAAKELEIKPIIEMGNTLLIKELIKENRGISFLPEFVVDEDIEKGQLCKLDVAIENVDNWRQLIYHKDKCITPAMEALIDLVKKMEGKLL
ncbi:MAG: LysR family transcriptional regulator [Anaerovoracaceae bacterium]